MIAESAQPRNPSNVMTSPDPFPRICVVGGVWGRDYYIAQRVIVRMRIPAIILVHIMLGGQHSV